MQKNFGKIYTLSLNSIKVLSVLLLLLLSVSGLFFTSYADNMETQKALIKWDNLLFCLPLILLAIVLYLGAARLITRKPLLGKRILLTATFGWILLSGCILILFSKTVPAADAMSVYGAAEALAGGDTSVIHATGSYLSYYPQQVGLMAFFEVLHRIWNLFSIDMPAYHFFKGIYLLLLCLAVYFQYKSVHLLWEDDLTDCLYLLLAGTHLPLLMYASFVYGEIPSFTAFSMGLYFLLKLLKEIPLLRRFTRQNIVHSILCLVFLTISVMLRKNTLILIIAIVIVLILESLRYRRAFPLLLAILCIVCSLSILPIVESYYEHRSGNTISSGVTATSYFAMGMQEASRGCGWYNGFNISTYEEAGLNTELANEISRQAIRERLDYFKENPAYALSFYQNKFLTQWVDGTYASRQATLATFGGRREFFVSLYEGEYSAYYIEYCNTLQNVIYLGALLFALMQCLHKKETGSSLTALPMYLGSIGVLGGFLFHIIWEANSRYIFVYGLLLIPYAARGLGHISTTLSSRLSYKRKHPEASQTQADS